MKGEKCLLLPKAQLFFFFFKSWNVGLRILVSQSVLAKVDNRMFWWHFLGLLCDIPWKWCCRTIFWSLAQSFPGSHSQCLGTVSPNISFTGSCFATPRPGSHVRVGEGRCVPAGCIMHTPSLEDY
jgi:hypothetical protein